VTAPSSVIQLEKNGTTFHVVGTAHVSARSVEEVTRVIEELRPEVVCVELCQGRHDALTQENSFRNLDIFKVVREGKTLYLLAHLALASYQRKMGNALGVKPGSELLAAIVAAKKVGARVELIDRDIHTTLKRTWANLGLWKRSMLLSSLLVGFGEDDDGDDDKGKKELTEEDIENLKEGKALSEMLDELAKALPEVKTPLIDERDAFLVSGMEDAAKGAKDVVAVVGAAHVPGMRKRFGQPVDREALAKLPPPSVLWTIVKWAVPLLLVGALVWGAFNSENVSAQDVVMALVVPTSVGAGVLTLLTGGRPLSVLTAIVVAPIAAIHPLLGTGMVVGVVEAWARKPTVVDCERLPDDVTTLRGFWRNPVSRILLVAIASGLGTALGMWLGAAWIVTLL
jgi:pheromone shutdown-related protein TraB